MQDTYTDPEVEGTVLTETSKAAAREYIQGKIKAHTAIVQYYKNQYNALSITCRIPSEILSAIFNEVVDLAETSVDPWSYRNNYFLYKVFKGWIRAISHVCSHWRGVALATANLWSIIPVENPRWAMEMIKRCKDIPLTVEYEGMFLLPKSRRIVTPYTVLTEVFSSHVPHIKNLILGNEPMESSEEEHERSTQLVALLKQAAPVMEHLEIHLSPDGANMLPNEIVRGMARLKNLILEGCGMTWEVAGFPNLKMLHISHVPAGLNLSMIQLLGVLSQTPLLESLEVTFIDHSINQSSLPGAMPISLAHLERINLSCDLASSALFFDNVIFSRNVLKIELCHAISSTLNVFNDFVTTFMKRLASKVQDDIEGSLTRLKLRGNLNIQCWKSKSEIPEMPANFDEPVLGVDLEVHGDFDTAIGDAFWKSLRLDQLLSMEVQGYMLEVDAWMIFGSLPLLEDLQVTYDDHALLEALSQGTVAQRNTLDLRPSFEALRSLTIIHWNLASFGGPSGETIARDVMSCFRARKSAGLHLKSLTLLKCSSVDNETRVELQKWIKKVHLDKHGDFEDEDSESEIE